MNAESPDNKTTSKERIIQPSAEFKKEFTPQEQKTVTEPTAADQIKEPNSSFIQAPALDPAQQAVIAVSNQHTQESDRPVSLRVKSLLAIGILGVLASILLLGALLSPRSSSTAGPVLAITGVVQLAISVYLLLAKSHTAVKSILKLYLVLGVISLVFSILNPIGFITNAGFTLFTYYVYSRVKSLSY